MIGATAAHGGAGTCVFVLELDEWHEWGWFCGLSMIHAQGLEGLDGVVRPEFDKCLDDVEAPYYCSVRLLGGRLESKKSVNSLVKEDIVGGHFVGVSIGIFLPLDLVMFKESLDSH